MEPHSEAPLVCLPYLAPKRETEKGLMLRD